MPKSQDVWDRLWRKHKTTFDDEITDQWGLFDYVKQKRMEYIFPPPPAVALECGCGSARSSIYFARNGYRCFMLDYSREAIRVARNNFMKEELPGFFVLGDVERLPFRDGIFDIVMSYGLLEHFEDIHAPTAEMVRVLGLGGFYFADLAPKRFSVQTIGDVVSFALKFAVHVLTLNSKKARLDYKVFKPDYYENSLSAEEYRKASESAGLVDVRVVGDRPFPALILPSFLERVYVRLLKRLMFLWDRFDGTRLALYLGAGWWAYGVKSDDSAR